MTEREGLFRTQAIMHKSSGNKGSPLIYQPGYLRAAIIMLVAIVLTASVLISQMNYKTTVPVRGNLHSVSGSIKVHVPVVGRIDSIAVVPGQSVKQGDVLAHIVSQQYDIQATIKQALLKEQLNQQRSFLTDEERLQQQAQTDEQDRLEMNQLSLHQSQQLVDSEMALLQEQIALGEKNLDAQQLLLERGGISRLQVDQFASNVLSLKRQAEELEQRSQQIQNQQSDMQLQLEQLPQKYAQMALEMRRQVAQLDNQLKQLDNERAITLVAPEDGIVTTITATANQLTNPQEPLLYISPQQNELEAVLYVPSRAMGKVEPGQQVLMSYDAYDHQNFGRQESAISSISRNSVDPREHLFPIADLREPVYLVKAKLSQQYVGGSSEGDEIYRLQEGSLFTAEIVTADMSLIEHLFEPLLKLRRKS